MLIVLSLSEHYRIKCKMLLYIIGQDKRHSALDLISQYTKNQAAFLPSLKCLHTDATDFMMNKLPVNQ